MPGMAQPERRALTDAQAVEIANTPITRPGARYG